MMQTLLQSEGWQLFQASVLEPLFAQALQAVMAEKESFHAAKHIGILKVAQDLKSWAEREILVARATIESIERG